MPKMTGKTGGFVCLIQSHLLLGWEGGIDLMDEHHGEMPLDTLNLLCGKYSGGWSCLGDFKVALKPVYEVP
jgi:hypothetical protein